MNLFLIFVPLIIFTYVLTLLFIVFVYIVIKGHIRQSWEYTEDGSGYYTRRMCGYEHILMTILASVGAVVDLGVIISMFITPSFGWNILKIFFIGFSPIFFQAMFEVLRAIVDDLLSHYQHPRNTKQY